MTKIPKIKQDLFPKEVGLKSNKNQSKRSLDIHKDKVLLRVLQGRPLIKPSKGYQDVPSQMKEGFSVNKANIHPAHQILTERSW